MLRSFVLGIAAILPASLLLQSSAASAAGSQATESAAPEAFNRVPTLTPQESGTTNRLQAISPVNSRVVWASGVGGTYVRTTDGGETWKAGVVPGAESLQFRDVQGIDGNIAYLLSAGSGTDSRIYKTENGGESWALQFENQDPNAFYDCFSFWSPNHGITTSDSVNGRFPAIRTTNGKTWEDIGDHMPPALPGEASFAASGTCVATHGSQQAWIATGGATKARILATTDGGNSWEAYDTPTIQGTPSAGVLSVAFRDADHGILGAGELAAPLAFSNNVARSRDGGKSWQLATGTPFTGAIYGLSYTHDCHRVAAPSSAFVQSQGSADETNSSSTREDCAVVATGPAGVAWSPDEGDTWFTVPHAANYWAVAFANERAGWLVGVGGRILKVSF